MMRICIIGSGRVASCLMPALREAGHYVVEQSSRAEAISVEADVYIFCIKDDALPEVVKRMHTSRPEAFFVHTSGSVPLSVFEDAGHKRGGVLYPMQTFTKNRKLDFAAIHYFVEATHAEDLSSITGIARSLCQGNDANIHLLSSEHRRRIHLAAVFACNFVNHCCTLADEVLQPTGLTFDVMQPLLEETASKLRQFSPQDAQTGPAIRWDEHTIDKHIAMLDSSPLTQQIYRLMSDSIHQHSI